MGCLGGGTLNKPPHASLGRDGHPLFTRTGAGTGDKQALDHNNGAKDERTREGKHISA